MFVIKTQTVLEIKKEDRIYKFEFAPDSPSGEIYDALTLMKNFVIQQIQESEKSQEPSEVSNG